jgi:predicted LPLAT superfamily acyltransferase
MEVAAEQWIKEGKYALNWTRLSCKRFISNQVRLWLFVLAYNLVTSESARKAHQDWSEGCQAQQMCYVSDGRGRDRQEVICRDTGTD